MGNHTCGLGCDSSVITIKKQLNILLAGPSGVGKTFLVDQLNDKVIYGTSPTIRNYKTCYTFHDKNNVHNQLNITDTPGLETWIFQSITSSILNQTDAIVLVYKDNPMSLEPWNNHIKQLMNEVNRYIPLYYLKINMLMDLNANPPFYEQLSALQNLQSYVPSTTTKREVKKTFLRIFDDIKKKNKNKGKLGDLAQFNATIDIGLQSNVNMLCYRTENNLFAQKHIVQ